MLSYVANFKLISQKSRLNYTKNSHWVTPKLHLFFFKRYFSVTILHPSQKDVFYLNQINQINAACNKQKRLLSKTLSLTSPDLLNGIKCVVLFYLNTYHPQDTGFPAESWSLPHKQSSTSTRCPLPLIWKALTDNYGSVMPVDWSQSKARSLHLSALSIEDRPVSLSLHVNLDLSDDEDLREQMDTHSIIVSCISEEPLLTAEQVIEELEELMQDSPELESERMAPHSELSLVSQRSHSSQMDEERARLMSALELNDELEDVETAIRRYSEELIQQLAIRDELEFEKEVKNSFISVLIDVQNRQKLHREMLRKKRKVKNASGSERLPSSVSSYTGTSSRSTCVFCKYF
uniref:Si:dkey-288i20.2 n=1 Tax=Cyprinus carpio TaxID=7962 RepID=A0A8C2GGG2_CYPCA